MTTLLIARHGNTFAPDEAPRRVGARTDLPLVESGIEQAQALGQYLKDHKLTPDVVYTSNLQRTIQTAEIAIKENGIRNPVYQLDIFDEIDYGPDENKSEDDVIARIGKDALENWNARNVMPESWTPRPDEIIRNWRNFGEQIRAHDDNETILVVTSNGIARFAPYLTGDYETFLKNHRPKLATGALAIFGYENAWFLRAWNLKP